MLEESVPSWFIFFDIIKQLAVVGAPYIIRSATISLELKPRYAAIGKNIIGWIISFISVAATVGLSIFIAFAPSKAAPIVISAKGVVRKSEQKRLEK